MVKAAGPIFAVANWRGPCAGDSHLPVRGFGVLISRGSPDASRLRCTATKRISVSYFDDVLGDADVLEQDIWSSKLLIHLRRLGPQPQHDSDTLSVDSQRAEQAGSTST